jgi:hypothetical protein
LFTRDLKDFNEQLLEILKTVQDALEKELSRLKGQERTEVLFSKTRNASTLKTE